jgi:predicted CXXCH cytochrome family protein
VPRPLAPTLLLALLLPAVSHAGDKVGAETCRACHPAAYEAWRVSPHARALVEPGEKTCAGCHTDSTPSLSPFEYQRKLPLIRHWEERETPKKR